MRFSETPVSDPANLIPPSKRRPVVPPDDGSPANDRPAIGASGGEGQKGEGSGTHEERSRASELLRDIGTEFSRLRKLNRSGAWADLEDKIAGSGDILIASAMISPKDWIGMLIDIEQFRKAETGTAESPGDALAKWLSEGAEDKPKRKKAKAN
jgi:hypothetical protein